MALKLAMLPAPKAAVGLAQNTTRMRHGSQMSLICGIVRVLS
jgi:hypothetical protein